MSITVKNLQEYIKDKDFNPGNPHGYFYKLVEEVGELASSLAGAKRMVNGEIKNTVEEELYDVLYYVVAMANIYGVDLEECAILKERLNRDRYGLKEDLESFVSAKHRGDAL